MRASIAGAIAGTIAAGVTVASLSVLNTPAFAGAAARAESTIAVVDLYGVLETALQDPTAINERQTAAGIFSGQLETLQAEMQDIGTRVQALGFDNPESQPLIGEFQQKQQQAQALQGQLQQVVTELYSEQMETAYANIMEAANEIAAEGGYDIVISSRPAGEGLERGPVEVMIQELLARPVIKAPATIDLTDAVRERLGLEEIEAPDEPALGEAPIGEPMEGPAPESP